MAPGPVVGLREAGKWYKFVNIKRCLLLSEQANVLLNDFRDFIKEKALEPYDTRGEGGLRVLPRLSPAFNSLNEIP